ncbi:MAG TPA: hypothetical protein VNP92_01730 [Actinophytocola sp.]|nr:hypothetical protein [Actinophytocola sp.]
MARARKSNPTAMTIHATKDVRSSSATVDGTARSAAAHHWVHWPK